MRKELSKMKKEGFFPEIISTLPEANIPVPGCTGNVFLGKGQQLIFMCFNEEIEVGEHFHEAQWGVVLEGKIEMIIEGKPHIFIKGDTYFIPQGAKHQAKISQGYKAITLFNQENRYPIK